MSATVKPRFQGFEAGATTRTRIRIEIDGAPMVVRLATSVSAVLVRQALGVPAAAEIDCIDPVAEDVRTVRPGLRLSLGIDEPGDLFEGGITGLERDHGADGSFRLRVRAYDALHVARRRCRCGAWSRFLPAISPRRLQARSGSPPGSASRGRRANWCFSTARAISRSCGVSPARRASTRGRRARVPSHGARRIGHGRSGPLGPRIGERPPRRVERAGSAARRGARLEHARSVCLPEHREHRAPGSARTPR